MSLCKGRYRIEVEGYEYKTLAEAMKNKVRLQDIAFIGHEPITIILLDKWFATLLISDNNQESSGAFRNIDKVLKSAERKIYDSNFHASFTLIALGILSTLSILNFHVTNVHDRNINSILLFFMVILVVCVSSLLKKMSYILIENRRRSDKPNFYIRHKGLINGIIFIVIGWLFNEYL